MSFRAHCTPSARMAHAILDRAAAGEDISGLLIHRALVVLGDKL